MSNQIAEKPPLNEEVQPDHDLYALAICASKIDGLLQRMESRPRVCCARSVEEAIGKGVTKALAIWPQDQGWFQHGSSVLLVSREAIQGLAEIQARKTG